jgi:hypothetical protein
MEIHNRAYGSFLAVLRHERDLAAHFRRRSIPADVALFVDGSLILLSELSYEGGARPYVVRRHRWQPRGEGKGVLKIVLIGQGGWIV